MLCKVGQLCEALQALNATAWSNRKAFLESCICIFHCCINIKALQWGKWLHARLIGLHIDLGTFAWNTILSFYLKCEGIQDAVKVFDEMTRRNVFTWTMLIAQYVQHGSAMEALSLFYRMQAEDVEPDKITYLSVVNACGSIWAVDVGKLIHSKILKSGWEPDVPLGTALIDMYGKCGVLRNACMLFDRMDARNVISWSAMLAGYFLNGNNKGVLEAFEHMCQDEVKPDIVAYITFFNACAALSNLGGGKLLHAHVLKFDGPMHSTVSANSLIHMYVKCGCLDSARTMFISFPASDVVSWNIMLGGYAQHGKGMEAYHFFRGMQSQYIKPDEVTFVNLLTGCINSLGLEEGKWIHSKILNANCNLDVFIGSTLIDMYTKFSSLNSVHEVFDRMLLRSIVSWNAIIAGYALQESKKTFLLLEEMKLEGIEPNKVTSVRSLSACSDMSQGKRIHAGILKDRYETDLVISSALIDMYTRCASIEDAEEVFYKLPARDIVSWNGILATLAYHGDANDVFKMFRQMYEDGVIPNEVSFLSLLSACIKMASLEKGKQFHMHILRSQFMFDSSVGNNLIDMYANCGSIEDAQQVFDRLPFRNTVTWNAIITGYAQHGHATMVLNTCKEMQGSGTWPDSTSLTCLLCSCSYAGLIDEGCFHLCLMGQEFAITPIVQHYACLVDLFGHAGYMQEALELVLTLPYQPSLEMWRSLVSACRIHCDMELAEQAIQQVLQAFSMRAADV